jgi:hypothetical protein
MMGMNERNNRRTLKKNGGKEEAGFPVFCDYSCRYAGFAPVDSIGACRKEAGVFCSHLNVYNNKNNRCLARSTM